MNRSIVILVIENNPDQQLLIGYSLRTSIPQAKLNFATTANEALRYLYECSAGQLPCPKLILLNTHPSQGESGWQLLKELRTRYPRLPVLVLSAQHDPDFIRQSYEFGANSFIVKPQNLEGWELQFKRLAIYWLGVVTLPPAY
ncbi:response regulator [Spirosoma validum]|uniref:response regulator n=1 Tax=Spirosoma validum TaxID=2771355 RepID=UPI00293BAFA8|nr:response regulator [Spirosoma validum]